MKTLNALWKLFKYKPWSYLVNCFASVTHNLMILLSGIVIKHIFDAFTDKTFSSISGVVLVVLLFVTYIARIVSFYACVAVEARYRFGISGALRCNLLKEIFKLPGARSLSKPIGDVISRFRDDVQHIEDYIHLSAETTGFCIYIIVSLIILFRINTYMTLLVFTPLIIIVVAARIASTRITKYRKASRKAAAAVTANIGEMFGAIQAVQLAGAQKSLVKNFTKLNDERERFTLTDNVFSQVLNSIFNNTISIGTGLILLIGAQSIKNGTLGLGDFSLFIFNLTIVTTFIQFIGMILAQFRQVGVSLDRMAEVTSSTSYDGIVQKSKLYLKNTEQEEENIAKEASDRQTLNTLELKNISYQYDNNMGGIENINLKIDKNSFTVITGRIGAGKTTLVRTLLGLLPKHEGEILWNGDSIDNPAAFFSPPNCAYTPQVPHLLSETVRDNILLGLKQDKAAIEEAIDAAIMNADIDSLENGLDTMIGSRGTKLSGGQQQRVAAARMLIRDTDLIVFDDISSALDVETETQLWSKLFKRKNKTCIAVSNRRIALKHADHIIVLKNGKVEAQGKLEELLSNCEEMQLIWGS